MDDPQGTEGPDGELLDAVVTALRCDGGALVVLGPDGAELSIVTRPGDAALAVTLPLPGGRTAVLSVVRRAGVDPADQQLLAELVHRYLAEVTPPAALTRRETAVLELVGEGLTDRAVAHRLGIAEATVHKHLEHAYRKLGVSNRVAASAAHRRLRGSTPET